MKGAAVPDRTIVFPFLSDVIRIRTLTSVPWVHHKSSFELSGSHVKKNLGLKAATQSANRNVNNESSGM